MTDQYKNIIPSISDPSMLESEMPSVVSELNDAASEVADAVNMDVQHIMLIAPIVIVVLILIVAIYYLYIHFTEKSTEKKNAKTTKAGRANKDAEPTVKSDSPKQPEEPNTPEVPTEVDEVDEVNVDEPEFTAHSPDITQIIEHDAINIAKRNPKHDDIYKYKPYIPLAVDKLNAIKERRLATMEAMRMLDVERHRIIVEEQQSRAVFDQYCVADSLTDVAEEPESSENFTEDVDTEHIIKQSTKPKRTYTKRTSIKKPVKKPVKKPTKKVIVNEVLDNSELDMVHNTPTLIVLSDLEEQE